MIYHEIEKKKSELKILALYLFSRPKYQETLIFIILYNCTKFIGCYDPIIVFDQIITFDRLILKVEQSERHVSSDGSRNFEKWGHCTY